MKNSQKEAAIILNNMRVLLHEVCEFVQDYTHYTRSFHNNWSLDKLVVVSLKQGTLIAWLAATEQSTVNYLLNKEQLMIYIIFLLLEQKKKGTSNYSE